MTQSRSLHHSIRSTRLAFANYMPVSVAHFVSFEVLDLVETLSRFWLVAAGWHGAVVAVVRMEMVVDVAVKAFRAMEPRTSADEDATRKPFRAVVSIGSAVVGSDV